MEVKQGGVKNCPPRLGPASLHFKMLLMQGWIPEVSELFRSGRERERERGKGAAVEWFIGPLMADWSWVFPQATYGVDIKVTAAKDGAIVSHIYADLRLRDPIGKP